MYIFSISVPLKIKYSVFHATYPEIQEQTTIFKLDEVWFNSLSSFITKFREMNPDFEITEEDDLKIFWINTQGDEVLIGNDEHLQLALENSRNLYTPASIRNRKTDYYDNSSEWNIKLLYALTVGLYNGYSPYFTLRIINLGIINKGKGGFFFHGEATKKYNDDGTFTLHFESPTFYDLD